MQRRRPDARALLYERIRTSPPKFVHVTGVPYLVEIPPVSDPNEADHIWLTLEVPSLGRIRTVINTVSKLCRSAGHNPHVRVAIQQSSWMEKPQTGLIESEGQNYGVLESSTKVNYTEYDQMELSDLLSAKAKKAVRAEVWGDLYARDHLGVRQIHSRRASKAVPEDVVGRDGALKLFYGGDNKAELFLFKFAGQA
ncbi:MAG TPA: hypothetical protein VGH90_01850 [Chthoniobacteraceae bacterium]|jgi:hypothetical protein